jgi:alkylhydroperoxidase family enzyme
LALGKDLAAQAMADPRKAPIPEPLRETLLFLEKLTREPGAVGPQDLEPLRRAGLSDEAIEDAIYVCTVFNTIVRIADALQFEVPSAAHTARSAQVLLRLGYRF